MKYFYTLLAFWVGFNCTLSAQSEIVEMEYYIDEDPGFGMANSITGFTTAEQVLDHLASTTNFYTAGIHLIGVRAMDSDGVWSHTRFGSVNSVVLPSASEIVVGEYFIGEDPGLGEAVSMSAITPQAIVEDWLTEFDPTLANGIHVLGTRVMDDENKWSHTRFGTLRVVSAPDPEQGIVAVEYVWDDDEGFHQSGVISLSEPIDPMEMHVIDVPIPEDVEIGSFHVLGLRVLDSYGSWSHTVFCDGSVGVYEASDDTIQVDVVECDQFISPAGIPISVDTAFVEFGLVGDILQAYHYSVEIVGLDVSVELENGQLQGPEGLDSYQWIDCDNGGIPIDGATSSSFIPDENGSYALQAELSGCSAVSDCQDVIIDGIEEEVRSMFRYYPNPVQDQLVLDFQGDSYGGKLEVIDLSGKMIIERQVRNGLEVISLGGMTPGVYMLRFSTDLGSFTDRMVKL